MRVIFFGGKKGKRGRGAVGKIPVFGLLKRNGKIYTKILNNCRDIANNRRVCREG